MKSERDITWQDATNLSITDHAVAVLYGDGSMNMLGSGNTVPLDLKEAFEEVNEARADGDTKIRVVIIDRSSIKFMEVK